MDGKRIKMERAVRGISAEDLAKALNRSRKTINDWENNRTRVPVDSLAKMCEIFGCTSDWLLGRTENRSGR